MAGDWFQRDSNLRYKPEVQQIVTLTGLPDTHVCGYLDCFWGWVDEHADRESEESDRGIMPGMGIVDLCRNFAPSDETFWLAVQTVGWIELTERGVIIPKFVERFPESAKKRAIENRRKRMARMDIELKTPEPRPRKRRASSPPAEPETPDTLSIEAAAEQRRSSDFDRVTLSTLSNPNQLLEWWTWACQQRVPIGIDDAWHQARVLAAAQRTLHYAPGKSESPISNPLAFFRAVVGRKEWTKLDDDDVQRGRTLLAQCRQRTDVRNAHVRQAVQNVVKRPPHEQKSTLTLTEQRAALLKIQSKKQA